ncbi:MAG: abortive infection family protein [Symploca sp. SIO3C6]|nr:abortive infection family protein [Symploca sp. SIO3C6]
MSNLTNVEQLKLEDALGMRNGYVLKFSNQTFAEFFAKNFDVDIYDAKYDKYGSGSKANRMRAFWNEESNYLVGRVLDLLFTKWDDFKCYDSPEEPSEDCLKIVQRLKDSTLVPDIEAIENTAPNYEDQSFDALVRSVKSSIERGEPETGLDRLHTYLVKYFRSLCNKKGINTSRDKPLHSLVGEYVKALEREGLIESEMTKRILKSSISVMEAFNRVRNEHSLAHDNKLLNRNESFLILGHVASSIKFIDSLENQNKDQEALDDKECDELPF